MTIDEAVAVRDRARFRVPAAPPGVVPRPRLERLYPPPETSLVRVLAPGGFGKSTLAARWMEAESRAVRWVDLEATDDDGASLLRTLSRALSGLIDPVVASLTAAPLAGPTLDAVVIPTFARLVESVEVPFVLVVDDVHRLRSTVATDLLTAVALHIPRGSTLVLVGRAHHGDQAMARLRLRGAVLDVSEDDLALEDGEAGQLLGAMGLELDGGEVGALVGRMEGWPAGLRLVGLMLSEGASVGELLDRDHGDPALVVDYVQSEWTGGLAGDDLAFLHGAACLDRFSAETLDAVLGRSDSAERLRRLHRDARLLLPLDRRDAWFRMHSLLSRWLESDFRDRDPARHRAVHLAAASYWEERGDIDLAIRHAVSSGELGVCEVLVGRHGGPYLARGHHSVVQRWLDLFPGDHIASSAELCAIRSICALHGGDGNMAMRWCSQLHRLVGREGSAVGAESIARADVLAATLELRGADELIGGADRARHALAPGVWRALACWTTGGLRFLDGDPDAADVLEEGAFEARLFDAAILRANCLATAAVVLGFDEDRDRVSSLRREAHDLVAAHHAELLPTTAMVAACRAWAAAESGRREEALDAMDLGRRHLRSFASVAPWFNVLVRIGLVRAAMRLDERPLARALLEEVDPFLRFDRRGRGAEVVVARHSKELDSLGTMPDHLGGLTPAELRVLDHLPTNLSLSEIAGELFLSRNTVKSHAAAIYRKLGVTSRGDAVQLARAAGLLGHGRRR